MPYFLIIKWAHVRMPLFHPNSTFYIIALFFSCKAVLVYWYTSFPSFLSSLISLLAFLSAFLFSLRCSVIAFFSPTAHPLPHKWEQGEQRGEHDAGPKEQGLMKPALMNLLLSIELHCPMWRTSTSAIVLEGSLCSATCLSDTSVISHRYWWEPCSVTGVSKVNIFMQMLRSRPRLRKLLRVLSVVEILEGHFSTKEEKKEQWVSQHTKWMKGTLCLLWFVWWDIWVCLSLLR